MRSKLYHIKKKHSFKESLASGGCGAVFISNKGESNVSFLSNAIFICVLIMRDD